MIKSASSPIVSAKFAKHGRDRVGAIYNTEKNGGIRRGHLLLWPRRRNYSHLSGFLCILTQLYITSSLTGLQIKQLPHKDSENLDFASWFKCEVVQLLQLYNFKKNFGELLVILCKRKKPLFSYVLITCPNSYHCSVSRESVSTFDLENSSLSLKYSCRWQAVVTRHDSR